MPEKTPRARVVLGVSAGIAAYKACELLRLLTESGHEVRVLPTRDALRFVGEPTWAALSGHQVATEVWDGSHEVPHVRMGQEAALVLVAPATADLLARAAHGHADDLLTSTLLTARCPVVYAPAMHTEMWEHPATRDNVATLRARGAIVVDPAVGRLTGVDTGRGRLPEPDVLLEVARRVLARGQEGASADLRGRRVVISAGGTHEPIDPVRFIGNRSSGRQGYALARTAVARGAEVTVVAANVSLPDPAGAAIVRVGSAEELRAAVLDAAATADVVVMAAAVADFRPGQRRDSKIKKTDSDPEPIGLVRNPDILTELSGRRAKFGQLVVGFAAETEDPVAGGLAKLAQKGADLLVVNEVGEGMGFGRTVNAAVVLGADSSRTQVPLASKNEVADAIWDQVVARLPPADWSVTDTCDVPQGGEKLGRSH